MRASEMDPATLRALADEMEKAADALRRSRPKSHGNQMFVAGKTTAYARLKRVYRLRATRAERAGRA